MTERAPISVDLIQYSRDFRDLTDLQRKMGELSRFAPRVYAGGLLRAARRSRTRIKKKAQAILNVRRVASITERLKVKPSAIYAVQASGNVLVVAEERRGPPNLTSFKGTKQTSEGLLVKVRKKGKQELYPHAFLAKGRNKFSDDQSNQNVLAFSRQVVNGVRVPRLKIFTEKGPSVVGLLLGMPGFLDAEAAEFADDVSVQVDGSLAGFLARRQAMRQRRNAA